MDGGAAGGRGGGGVGGEGEYGGGGEASDGGAAGSRGRFEVAVADSFPSSQVSRASSTSRARSRASAAARALSSSTRRLSPGASARRSMRCLRATGALLSIRPPGHATRLRLLSACGATSVSAMGGTMTPRRVAPEGVPALVAATVTPSLAARMSCSRRTGGAGARSGGRGEGRCRGGGGGGGNH